MILYMSLRGYTQIEKVPAVLLMRRGQLYGGGKHKCVFSALNSSKKSYQLQEKLPDGAVVAPVIIASDKTHFQEYRTAWPVYLTIGNISKEKRRQVCHLPTL
jgi:hypothetical protein